MIDLTFLSQSMWNIYSACAGTAKSDINAVAESLMGMSFQELLNSAGGTLRAPTDPKKQLMDDYYAWKATQPPQYLPESKGDTEENRAYLRRNFSGQLSVMERIYALDTMREMGMITEEEMREAIGVNEFNISIVNIKEMDMPLVFAQPMDLDPAIVKWNEFFLHANISRCPTLDKLLSMTQSVRETFAMRDAAKGRNEQQTAAQEVESALNVLTSRKAS